MNSPFFILINSFSKNPNPEKGRIEFNEVVKKIKEIASILNTISNANGDISEEYHAEIVNKLSEFNLNNSSKLFLFFSHG